MPEVRMPRLSDTMTEGIIAQWLKNEGDEVRSGEALAEIETDKATMDLEAYDTGTLTRILVAAGSTVPIGQPIAVIGDAVPTTSVAAPESVTTNATPVAITPTVARQAPVQPNQASAAAAAVRTSPLARALAREHGLDLATVAGSGPGGRIVRADVDAAIAERERKSAGSPAVTAPQPAPTQPAAEDTDVPLTAVRRITAQRLTDSAAAPHFYLTAVLDAAPLLALRADINAEVAPDDLKITVTDLLVRGCALALRAHPQVNASWGGDHLVRHGRIHLGVAVALDDGLIVPVIRDADRKTVGQIAAEAHALAARARAGKLGPDEFTGGTFTISNLGMYGIDHFTAVINPPEAAILAVGAAQQEPVVRDGQLAIGTTMKLTLSIDHRVLDGATAAAFLYDLVALLEHPLRLLIGSSA
jgi:pyruvate dehydrogenase E2 component (dihydrolipoamide acetyltransferase)